MDSQKFQKYLILFAFEERWGSRLLVWQWFLNKPQSMRILRKMRYLGIIAGSKVCIWRTGCNIHSPIIEIVPRLFTQKLCVWCPYVHSCNLIGIPHYEFSAVMWKLRERETKFWIENSVGETRHARVVLLLYFEYLFWNHPVCSLYPRLLLNLTKQLDIYYLTW